MSPDTRDSSANEVPSIRRGLVLVVDDDDATRKLIMTWLQRADLPCAEAASGEQALDVVNQNPMSFDAILLDVMMPGIDGYEVVKRLKASSATAPIPVLLLTAHANSDADVIRAVEYGAVDHLSKPFSGPVLVAKLRAVCERARGDKKVRLKLAFAEQHATIDALTKLFNRRAFERRLKEECAYAKRHMSPLACAVVDLDHFKSVNDTYGHEAGDRVLEHLAETMRFILRQEDVPCRIGGEEFVVLLRETRIDDAVLVMKRLQSALKARPVELGGQEKKITFSCGVAAADHTNAFSCEGMVQRADDALYSAKRNGRDRVETA
jgi:two-component system cell cycle response regulator